jgi:hypothetical protein
LYYYYKMYNINFEVKYHDIEIALLMNLQKKLELRLAKESSEYMNNRNDMNNMNKDINDADKDADNDINDKADNKEESTEGDSLEDYDYTLEDVYDICEKLYRDELLSVFNVESISDENIDVGIKSAIEQMIDNESFRLLLDDIKNNLIDFDTFTVTPTELENMKRNSEYLIFITLFSQKLFYLTHKCLCQLFTVGEIDKELLLRVKEKTISLFKKD